MIRRVMGNSKKIFIVFTVLVFTQAFAQKMPDYFTQGTFYQGVYQPKPDSGTTNTTHYLKVDRPQYLNPFAHLFTTTFHMVNPDGSSQDAWIPDLLYKVKAGEGVQNLGLRLIPVSYSIQGAAGSVQIDRFLKSIFSRNPDEVGQYYSIVAHTEAGKDYYDDAKAMVAAKGEFSVFHSSTNYGNNQYSRRGFSASGNPKNIFAVSLKGTPQVALNANARIWSKLYYQNPVDHYQFAEDYHQDPVTNVNLEEVLAFATGWIDHDWVRRDLNAKVMAAIASQQNNPKVFNKDTSYYYLLQNEPMFYLYCFEGVVHTLNMALNIPLTEEYFKKIWGTEWGTKMFGMVNERWRTIQVDDGVPAENVQNLNDPALKTLLSQVKPLWESDLSNSSRFNESHPLFLSRAADGSAQKTTFTDTGVRLENPTDADAKLDTEAKELGRSLAVTPQTTGDILKDFIAIYAPFHKVGAVRSAAMMLGFKDTVVKRTGIDAQKFYDIAGKVIAVMFRHSTALERSKYSVENLDSGIAGYRAKVKAGLNQVMGSDSLFNNIVSKAIDNPAELVVNDQENAGATAWNNFVKEDSPIMTEANKTEIAQPDPILLALTHHLSDGTNNPYLVKYNVSPGILASIATRVYPTNKNVLFTPVATIIDEPYVEMKPEAERGDSGLQELIDSIHAFSAETPQAWN